MFAHISAKNENYMHLGTVHCMTMYRRWQNAWTRRRYGLSALITTKRLR
jgi:hypothetical protein